MTATASLAGRVLGNYRLLSLIGVGGMGQVYRARDERLNREVAVKVIHPSYSANPDAISRFKQEAQTLAALSHPNLLAIYDVGVDGETSYIVSELLEGETLRKKITRERLSYHGAIDFAVQVVRGLVAAHEKGIVHRDLKPENVFLTNQRQVKILDFGLAKLTGPELSGGNSSTATSTLFHTQEATVLGTVAYMSPEQVRGETVDHRSDIFSFGAMLFEMLTGKRAFGGETTADVITAILKEQPDVSQTSAQVPPTASLVVQHCIEKRREDRFQSAKDLLFDLTLLSNSQHSSGAVVPTAEAKSRRVKRGRA